MRRDAVGAEIRHRCLLHTLPSGRAQIALRHGPCRVHLLCREDADLTREPGNSSFTGRCDRKSLRRWGGGREGGGEGQNLNCRVITRRRGTTPTVRIRLRNGRVRKTTGKLGCSNVNGEVDGGIFHRREHKPTCLHARSYDV